jgi:hypothetical protein
MARKWSNLNLPGALHYVTGNCINRLPIFTAPECCQAFINELASLSLKFAQQACRLLMVSVPEGPNVYSDGCKKIFAPAERNVSRFRRQIALLRSARGVS